jgi:hypothetical protein
MSSFPISVIEDMFTTYLNAQLIILGVYMNGNCALCGETNSINRVNADRNQRYVNMFMEFANKWNCWDGHVGADYGDHIEMLTSKREFNNEIANACCTGLAVNASMTSWVSLPCTHVSACTNGTQSSSRQCIEAQFGGYSCQQLSLSDEHVSIPCETLTAQQKTLCEAGTIQGISFASSSTSVYSTSPVMLTFVLIALWQITSLFALV